ncbi:MAG: heat shock protein HspQ [Hyphomonas sp.]
MDVVSFGPACSGAGAFPAETPFVLDRPVDREMRYNAVSEHVAKFQIGQVVRHRHFPFRGIIFDVDPQFANNGEEWYESTWKKRGPARTSRSTTFAENDRTHYVAYVSEQNLVADESTVPLSHPDIPEWFGHDAARHLRAEKRASPTSRLLLWHRAMAAVVDWPSTVGA